MDDAVKYRLTALISDIVAENSLFLKERHIMAEIRLKKEGGCVIVLTPEKKEKDYLFEFVDSESLILAATKLYKIRHTAELESSIYKMPDSYRLEIKGAKSNMDKLLLEFYSRECIFQFESEYTYEHGKPIVIGDAVEKFGAAFFKAT